ncbi:YheC/YheD family protein [Tumebacillus lipolyticus]|uniref:YheC/YheD family protein n=1 Tax=Tumebacillus lipolyticus TaxID=1280370 RepID=A0ABW4ZV12_9BACL
MKEKRPLFGVMTTAVGRRAGDRRQAVAPAESWIALEQRAHELGIRACLFHPEDFDRSLKRVHGLVCERAGEKMVWRRVVCPLPEIVYDNVYVHLSSTLSVMRVRHFLERRGTPTFNPRMGNKAELADWLRKYPDLWKHHPETMQFTDRKQVNDLLSRHRSVYLKPVLGSAGQGIVEIRPEGEQYRVRAVKYGRDRRSISLLMSEPQMLAWAGREQRRMQYIAQGGCELIWIDDSKIDLRTHLQRNRKGEWECVGLVVKRGSPHSIVSNYHAGGSVHSFGWLMRHASEQGFPMPDRQKVIELSIAICKAYAEKSSHLASLGLDLGIDQTGQLWLLDVNARPGRNILDEQQKLRCQQLNAEFASYLLSERKINSL